MSSHLSMSFIRIGNCIWSSNLSIWICESLWVRIAADVKYGRCVHLITTIHRFLERRSTYWSSEELYLAVTKRCVLLPFTSCPTPRFEAPKFTCRSPRQYKVSRFRFGTRLWRSSENVHPWSNHVILSSPRNTSRRQILFDRYRWQDTIIFIMNRIDSWCVYIYLYNLLYNFLSVSNKMTFGHLDVSLP